MTRLKLQKGPRLWDIITAVEELRNIVNRYSFKGRREFIFSNISSIL